MQAGSLEPLQADIPTYATLSLFYLYNTVAGQLADLPGRYVLVVIPISLGVMLPLCAGTLTAIVLREHQNKDIAIGVAVALASVAPVGVLFSYWPIVQSIAVLLWVPLLIAFILRVRTGETWFSAVFIFLTKARINAHKLSLLVPGLVISLGYLVWRIPFPNGLGTSHRRTRTKIPIKTSWAVAILLFVFLVILQWVYLTIFARVAVLSKSFRSYSEEYPSSRRTAFLPPLSQATQG